MEVLNDPSESRRNRQALWSKLFSELEEFVVTTKEFRPWSSLPIKFPKIMELILSHLYYSDHARVHAVCKAWSSMHRVAPMKQLPWLILWGKDSCRSFKLIDPQYSRIYTIEMETTVFEGKDLSKIEIFACKHSWFLMSSSTHQHVYSFVLYNPFMNSLERVIELPILNSNQNIQLATFSSNPTSPDCVFFTLSYDYTTVDINTCSRGDTAWTMGTFRNNLSMDEPVNPTNVFWGMNYSVGRYGNVAYLDGKFYWASFFPETVGTYSIAEKDYHLYEYPPMGSRFGSIYLVKSNIDRVILLVRMENSSRDFWKCPEHDIYRLDHSQMTWTKIDSLDDQVLCLGYHNDAVALSVEDKETENKIYLCKGRSIEYFEISSERHSCLLNQYNLPNDLEYPQRIYIEPPSQEDGFADSLHA